MISHVTCRIYIPLAACFRCVSMPESQQLESHSLSKRAGLTLSQNYVPGREPSSAPTADI